MSSLKDKYKIVFIDIDGTLVNDKKEITPEVKETINKLKEKNIPIILTSGRLPTGMLKYLDELELTDPFISFSGSLIFDGNRNIISEDGLTYNEASNIYNFYLDKKPPVAFNYYIGYKWYTDNPDHPSEIWEAKNIGLNPEEAEFYQTSKEGDIIAKCLFAGGLEELNQLEEELREAFPKLRVVRSHDYLLEISKDNISKSKSMEKIAKILDIPMNSTIAIGDNFLDLEMLENASLPIIMENAPASMKRLLRNVKVAPSNNENGVSKVLNEIFELE